jgi:hypothetical protein
MTEQATILAAPVAPDPTHCQHMGACNDHSCEACEPRWRGQTGRSMLHFLATDPEAFLLMFNSLSASNKQETYAAIAFVNESTPDEAAAFIAARAADLVF